MIQMTSLDKQVMSFVVMMGLGLAIGLVFDIYQVLRQIIKPAKLMVHFTDLAIWLLISAAVFVVLLFTNWGEVRFYIFIGIGLGLVFYYRLISVVFKRYFKALIEKLIKLGRALIAAIIFPFGMLAKGFAMSFRIISRPLAWLKKVLKKGVLKCKVFLGGLRFGARK